MPSGIYRGKTISDLGKLAVFGCYDDSELYSRNQVLVDVLSGQFLEACIVRPTTGNEASTNNHQRVSGFLAVAKTVKSQIRNYISLFSQRSLLKDATCVFVPYPAYFDRLFLSLLLPRGWAGLIIVDAFLCLHDTVVVDRQLVRQGGVMARLVHWLEDITLNHADVVLIDTQSQKLKLMAQYALSVEKVWAVPVGVNETLWTPIKLPTAGDTFEVLFYGTFIPLHGIDVVVEAARILQEVDPSVRINLVGTGQTAEAIAMQIDASGLRNTTWIRALVEPQKLHQLMTESHCVLGIFGTTEKSANVVPYKVYQAMAANHLLITRSGPAMDDLLSGEERISGLSLIAPGDPQALADAVLAIKRNYRALRVSSKTREVYDSQLSIAVIRERLSDIQELL